jgi:hypothetical protein
MTTTNTDFKQYRFARIEGHRLTLARLKAQFPDRIADVDAFEKTIGELLTPASTTVMAPWRKSDIEQTAFREGHRMAVLEFYWAQRQQLRLPDPQPRCRRFPSA